MLRFALIVLLAGAVANQQPRASAILRSQATGAPSINQIATVPKGQIVERLVCLKNTNQSYALYLPSNYTMERKWPILYALDPGARGKLPVERYQQAAEQYGWIVAGLNNSRNGPIRQSADALGSVWDDTHSRFAIDDRRVYLTGFSGGARAAIFFAARCGECVAGVIGSGAGFPTGVTPSAALHFVYFGTVGIEDFNFPEMRSLDDALAKAMIAHRIEIFPGRHDWPPAPVAIAAVEWMELKAIKSGWREHDERLADAIWRKQLQQAAALEESKQTYAAFLAYIALKDSFKGARDLSEVEKKIAELGSNRGVKDAIRDEQQQIRKQKEIEGQIQGLIAARERKSQERDGSESGSRSESNSGEQVDRSNTIDPTVRLETTVAELQKLSKAPADTGDRRVARRVLDGLFIGLFEQGLNQLQTQKHYEEAIRTLKLATDVNPDRAGTFFYLAWAYAANGNKKKSLQALKTAVAKGFSDPGAIADNDAFLSLRNDPEYQAIMVTLRKGN